MIFPYRRWLEWFPSSSPLTQRLDLQPKRRVHLHFGEQSDGTHFNTQGPKMLNVNMDTLGKLAAPATAKIR